MRLLHISNCLNYLLKTVLHYQFKKKYYTFFKKNSFYLSHSSIEGLRDEKKYCTNVLKYDIIALWIHDKYESLLQILCSFSLSGYM